MTRAPSRSSFRAAHAARRALLALLPLATGCSGAADPDAYGTFEATEVVVSSQATGPLLRFTPVEGGRVAADSLVALVDTTALVLELAQLEAARATARARADEVGRQQAVLVAQQGVAERAWARTQRLAAEQAATAQQLDQAERDARTLRAQVAATAAQQRTAGREVVTADARVAQLRDRLARARVRSPITGTVLATYVREGELVQAGQPLFRVAALDTLELRAYVAQPQLATFRLGQPVTVHVDRAGAEPSGRLALAGVVAWVSARAEFTPTPVQTRDERAELVYAIKVRVPDPSGVLKIGMPADVTLGTGTPR